MKRCKNKSNLDIIRSYVNSERPFIQISMTGIEELKKRKEGEEWEDARGKKWKKVGGKKVAINKSSTIINEERCMICNADVRWGNRYDKQVWPKTRKCYDCFIEFDTQLKIAGLHQSYEKYRDLTNVNSYLIDFKSKLTETINWCENKDNKKLQYVNDDGSSEIETWIDNTDTIDKIKKDAQTDLKLVNDRLADVEKELNELKINLDLVKNVEIKLKEKYKDGRNTPEFKIKMVNS